MAHPRTTKQMLSFLGQQNVLVLIGLFLASHTITASAIAIFLQVSYGGPEVIGEATPLNYWHRFYYCLTSQISPGFTEFVPLNDTSRFLALLNGFIGLIVNAIYIALLVSQVLRPKNVFEFGSHIVINKQEMSGEIRVYSRLRTEAVYIEFSLYRFLLHTREDGRVWGRTEEVKIHPKDRKLLRSRYPYIIRFDLVEASTPWENTLPVEGQVRERVPIDWLSKSKSAQTGYFFVMVRAETEFGTVYQRKEYRVGTGDFRYGKSIPVFDNVEVTLEDWHNPQKGNWKNWNKTEPDSKLIDSDTTNERDPDSASK